MLFDRKLAESKTKAQAMIMAGQVSVEGKIINKSGFNISPYSLIEIKNLGPKWVSRGAYKLIKALACTMLKHLLNQNGYFSPILWIILGC